MPASNRFARLFVLLLVVFTAGPSFASDPVTQTVELSPGWITAVIAVEPDANFTTLDFISEAASQGATVSAIAVLENNQWQVSLPSLPSTAYDLEAGDGFFVYSFGGTVNIDGTRIFPCADGDAVAWSLSIGSGWTLGGLPVIPEPPTDLTGLGESINSQFLSVQAIAAFDDGHWRLTGPLLPRVPGAIQQADAYLLYSAGLGGVAQISGRRAIPCPVTPTPTQTPTLTLTPTASPTATPTTTTPTTPTSTPTPFVFSSDFATSPTNATLYGDALVTAGYLQLTTNTADQDGAIKIDAPTGAMRTFEATFDMYIWDGTMADGLGFSYGPDIPDGVALEPEEGISATGLNICFDTYENTPSDPKAIELRHNGTLLSRYRIEPRANAFVRVTVRVDSFDRVTVTWNDEVVIPAVRMPNYTPQANWRFGLAARTGGITDHHRIDNLSIVETDEAGSWSFAADFDSGQPPLTNFYGAAGITPAGEMRLTSALPAQEGSFKIQDSPLGASAFMATFDLFIGGGGGADGVSFSYGPDIPDSSFGAGPEGQSRSGLNILFDTYENGNEGTPNVGVTFRDAVISEAGHPLRTNSFVPVTILVDELDRVTVFHNGTRVIDRARIPNYTPQANWRFSLSGETGQITDNHWVDDLVLIGD